MSKENYGNHTFSIVDDLIGKKNNDYYDGKFCTSVVTMVVTSTIENRTPSDCRDTDKRQKFVREIITMFVVLEVVIHLRTVVQSLGNLLDKSCQVDGFAI